MRSAHSSRRCQRTPALRGICGSAIQERAPSPDNTRGAVHPGTSVAGHLVRQRRTWATVPEVSKAPLQPPSKAASRIWSTRRTCIRGRSVTGVLPRLDCLAARASPRKDRICPQAADGTGANAGTQTRPGTRTADHARPLNEEAYRTRIRLLALLGIAPLRCQLTTCATVLKRELGVDPTAATQGAHERLLASEELPSPQSARTTAAPLTGRHRSGRACSRPGNTPHAVGPSWH
jgi:hypothetical protein